MFSPEYISTFESLTMTALNMKSKISPYAALEEWKSLIEEIEDGYNWVAPELHNDLDNSRSYIQGLIDSKELKEYPEHNEFIKKVSDLDERYKELSVENPKWSNIGQWWHQRLLKKGTNEYLKMVRSFYMEIGFEPEELK